MKAKRAHSISTAFPSVRGARFVAVRVSRSSPHCVYFPSLSTYHFRWHCLGSCLKGREGNPVYIAACYTYYEHHTERRKTP